MVEGTDDEQVTETEPSRTNGYTFENIDSERLPPDLQYTPECDDNWIYPSGDKAGGRRDDVPAQGLELGVVSHLHQLEATVEAIFDGLTAYYDATDGYPRHRFIADKASFKQVTDSSIDIVFTCQPRPDQYDDLTEHMRALQETGNEDALTPNRESVRTLAAHLSEGLAAHDGVNSGHAFSINVHEQTLWDTYQQVGYSAIVERYAPLAFETLYDPLAGDVDFDEPGLGHVSDLSTPPAYLDVDHPDELADVRDSRN
jgi:hypothetical protein